MKTKGRIIDVILASILIVAFNVLFFLLVGTDNPLSVWISYGFVHAAWIVLLCTPAMLNRGDHPAVRAALYAQTIIYFLIELAAGCVFIYLRQESYTLALLVQVALFAVFMIIILANARANVDTAQKEAVRVADKKQATQIAMRIKMLSMKMNDPETRKQMLASYDRLMRTAVKNSPEVEQLNAEIDGVITTMEGAVADQDTFTRCLGELNALISQREETLKFNH